VGGATPSLDLLAATTNPGKLREIRELLGDLPITVRSLSDFPACPEPEETGATFAENARLKALYYAAQAAPVLTVAEDSGLEIDALDRQPGVHSARFLGPDATYAERFAAIQRRLAERPDAPRTARFVCALTLARGSDVLFETVGRIEGAIADVASGSGGFGYDPIFYYPPYHTTLAGVSQERKLRVAHRGKAFRQLAEWIRERSGLLGT
jgi:non-canonical purine NTP pyrophosphatase (RdgB/HAM1 family)